MATEVNTVKISIKTFGNDELKKLNATFGKINKTLVLNKKSLNDTVASILRVDKRAKSFNGGLARSNKTIREQIEAFKVLRDQVDKGGASYSRFTNEINKLNASLKIQPGTQYATPIGPQMDTRGRFAKMRDRFLGGAKNMGVGQRAALGAIAGSGVAGNLGAVGSFGLSGAAVGGPAGAAIGVGLGAVAEGIGFASEAASYAAEIQKLEIALAGVTKDQETFEYGLNVIAKTSKELNVPIAASTKQFTTLSASVLGAGGTIEDAEEVFTGVSNAIKATGGSADDVQSAIRAMSQIFGKGKVSAEELQGQLGERLAGAVVKFAEANGSTLEKLQKDLRDGTVGLDKIMKFAEKLNEDFAATAREVANSSADAGARLRTSMDLFKRAVGTSVLPIGAAFQKAFSDITLGILQSEDAMNIITGTLKILGAAVYATFAAVRFLTRSLVDMAKILYHIANLEFKKAFEVMKKGFKDTAETAKKDFEALGEMTIKPPKIEVPEGDGINKESNLPSVGKGDGEGSVFNLAEEFKKVTEEALKLEEQVGKLAVTTTTKLADAFADFFVEGKRGFADLARSAIKELQKIIIRAAFMKYIANPVLGALGLNADGNAIEGGEVVPSAKGNVFARNKIVPYKMGGIVNSPHIFPMKNGAGILGEAGPEGILPLKRGRDGKLGVIAQGGGVGNIVVNVDATGSSVEGDEQGGKELGRLISAAIQSELIEQQRPGGLLA